MPDTMIAIIGGGPSGLFAAQTLAERHPEYAHNIHVYDHKPTFGRKFLMAGRGGLNLTHSENFEIFKTRYGIAQEWMTPYLEQFTPDDLKAWCQALGEDVFIGTSGRIFPKSLKASPLLRAWQSRLVNLGVHFHLNHRWVKWGESDHSLVFDTPSGQTIITADAVLIAMGGASWPKLGSDAAWIQNFEERDILIHRFRPTNCGFAVPWSDYFKTRFSGEPLKTIALTYNETSIQGDLMIDRHGIEGGAVYAVSSLLREALDQAGLPIQITIDLRPGLSHHALAEKLNTPRKGKSWPEFLRKTINLPPVSISLLYEAFGREVVGKAEPETLAKMIKAVPILLTGTAGIGRAISSAGGIDRAELDQHLMLKRMPGVFVAGEMIDWEAPTGGYLLQGCFSTGFAAANGLINWLSGQQTLR